MPNLLHSGEKKVEDHQRWLDSAAATRGDHRRWLGREESQEGERDLKGFGLAEVEKLVDQKTWNVQNQEEKATVSL